jgi:ATP-dependent Clp protease adaptor protein ClpS
MEQLLSEDVEIQTETTSNLILHNDEVNTFDHVIQSLIDICNHTWEQAEQCSLFIHYKGKHNVKSAEYKKLKPLKEAFLERGIQATIE